MHKNTENSGESDRDEYAGVNGRHLALQDLLSSGHFLTTAETQMIRFKMSRRLRDRNRAYKQTTEAQYLEAAPLSSDDPLAIICERGSDNEEIEAEMGITNDAITAHAMAMRDGPEKNDIERISLMQYKGKKGRREAFKNGRTLSQTTNKPEHTSAVLEATT